MLKIVKATDVITIDRIAVGIYALPGIGKSTLAFTANKPLLLDFDRGSHRAKNRKDTVPIASWDDVAQMTREDLDPFETLIVDTVGRQLDFLSADIVSKNPKHGNAGNLSLQGYGVLKGRFTAWLNLMKTYGKDIVLVAHMDEKMEGDITKERIDVQGGSKSEIYKSLDAFGKLYIDGKSRKLDFSPREGSLGKNPAQMEILTVPDYQQNGHFLGDVIADIKKSINALSEDQQKAFGAVETWRTTVGEAKTPKEFNKLIDEAKESPVKKRILWDAANAANLAFDKDNGLFISDDDLSPILEKSVEQAKKPSEAPKPAPEPEKQPEVKSEPAKAIVEPKPEPGSGKRDDSQSARTRLILFKNKETAKGVAYQVCEFDSGSGKTVEVINRHKSLMPLLTVAMGKQCDIWYHFEKTKARKETIELDDIIAIDGVRYERGQKIVEEKPVDTGVAPSAEQLGFTPSEAEW